jgi:hypothetical protein
VAPQPDEEEPGGAIHIPDDEPDDDGGHPNTDGEEEADATDDEDGDEEDDAPPMYNLRPNRARDYSHRFDQQIDNPHHQLLQDSLHAEWKDVFGFVMHQMTATAGIKKHGETAVRAMFKEFAQLDDRDTFEPVLASDLTREAKREALRAVNLIKEKRTGELKGRTCADGRPQRSLYSKDETTSPTISQEALTLSLTIDAYEKRDVGIADVVGAYLHADMPDYVIMKITGDAVKIMCDVNPSYLLFVVVENGKEVLYLRLLKALYGCVKSALLWYNLFTSELVKRGFVLNPYDSCVANRMVDGKQCTICWYVDDMKVSHVDPTVVTQTIEDIEDRFGKMSVTRGKKHVFLGMNIEFNEDGTFTMTMVDHIKEAIEQFGEDVSACATSPGAKSLYSVLESSPTLTKEKGELFHRIVAKLLYVSSRARSDIMPTIAFLCTRVSNPTAQDWSKLKRLLRYLNDTLSLSATLGANGMTKMMTWVDAAYAVHPDMKSHTGGCVSLGRGVIMPKSTKQKLNTKSSTEAELVGASDYLPSTIWAKNFLEAQGYDILENVFYQDNQSAMRLEKNGRASAGQKSRHINIRYFFIKDRILSDNVKIMYCPTELMLADFYTKPLQGSLFKKFRSVILGYEPVSVLNYDASSSPAEERVGEGHPVDGGDVIKESSVSDYSMVQQAQTIVESDAEWTLITRRRGTRGGRGPRRATSHHPSEMEKTIKTRISTRYEVGEGKRCPITSYFE